MKCEICGKDILKDSQYIDYKYYHNDCIINLTKENQELQTEKEQLNSLVNSCQEEIRQLKKQLENANEQIGYLRRSIERKEERIIELEHERVPYENEYVEELKKQVETYEIEGYKQNEELNKMSFDIRKYKTQQKEFIKYMNDIIEDLETEDVDDEEMKGYLIQRIDTFKEILSKYKEIIGDDK